jgi:hypothetical protein
MVGVTLYTHERPGAGLTSTNVCRVKGAISLRVTTEGMTHEYPLKGLGPIMTAHNPNTRPASGKADLCLRIGDHEVDLAKRQWAVALVVIENDTTVYLLNDGLCSEIWSSVPFAGAALAQIEDRCCPREHELPPPIA